MFSRTGSSYPKQLRASAGVYSKRAKERGQERSWKRVPLDSFSGHLVAKPTPDVGAPLHPAAALGLDFYRPDSSGPTSFSEARPTPGLALPTPDERTQDSCRSEIDWRTARPSSVLVSRETNQDTGQAPTQRPAVKRRR